MKLFLQSSSPFSKLLLIYKKLQYFWSWTSHFFFITLQPFFPSHFMVYQLTSFMTHSVYCYRVYTDIPPLLGMKQVINVEKVFLAHWFSDNIWNFRQLFHTQKHHPLLMTLQYMTAKRLSTTWKHITLVWQTYF